MAMRSNGALVHVSSFDFSPEKKTLIILYVSPQKLRFNQKSKWTQTFLSKFSHAGSKTC